MSGGGVGGGGGPQTLGGSSRCGWVLGPSLDKIIKNVAWRKHSQLVTACKSALDKLHSLSDTDNSQDPASGSPLYGYAPSDADFLLQPLILALETASPKVVEPALDCVYRLFALGLIRSCEISMDHPSDGSSSSNVVFQLVESVCKCGGLGEEVIELAVLKVLLAAVRSPLLVIRGDCLVHIVKSCYNVYLGGLNGTNQICAKSVLAQMMIIVFARVEEDSMLAQFRIVSVAELLEFSDRNLNEGSSIQFAQNFISEVVHLFNEGGASFDSSQSPTPLPPSESVEQKNGDDSVEEVDSPATLSGYTKIREDGLMLFKNLCKLSMKFSSQEHPDDQILLRGKTLSLELLKVIMDNGGSIWRTNERQMCLPTKALILSHKHSKYKIICFNAMIDGYMKFGNVEDAKLLFEGLEDKNVGSWNAMISGFARCGMIEEARELFDSMPMKDDVSWSAMIDGYNQGGYYEKGLEIFDEMQKENVRPRKFILSSVVAACGNVGALDQGRWIQGYVRRKAIPINAVLGTSFVDMYAKCGRLDLAWEVFEKMKVKEVFSWNAMIGSLAIHGRARDAVDLFEKMEKEMVKPDDITFLNILNACAHGGLVDEGMWFLKDMKDIYGVEPNVEHYGCVVDLLGRAGLFNEAEELIGSMPMAPNGAILGALLGACWKHGNLKLGEKVGNILLELEPQNSGRYTLLSNIYAKAGRWEDASRVRKLMKERGVKTNGGSSVIDLEGIRHEFKVGDSTHPQSEKIYSMLEKINERLQSEGYLANTSQVLFDIDEKDKENAVWHHSERLAIAYGLINTTPGSAIRVMKNLRVCEDCHLVTKLISKVYEREIIVRDRCRFHHFKNGKCSCNDFW